VSALNSFDRIAPVYDRLADIVFGTAILDAQRTHLHALNDAREILILGGGTGRLLRDLLGQNAKSRVTYVEASQRMIELALKGRAGWNLTKVKGRVATRWAAVVHRFCR
jgi:ubiquinone/menaquinone biosynthesis C-methylase UbiE